MIAVQDQFRPLRLGFSGTANPVTSECSYCQHFRSAESPAEHRKLWPLSFPCLPSFSLAAGRCPFPCALCPESAVALHDPALRVHMVHPITHIPSFTAKLLSLWRGIRCKWKCVDTILQTNTAGCAVLTAVTGSGLAGDEARMSNMGCFRSG